MTKEEHSKTNQKDALFRLLRELAKTDSYISFDQIKSAARSINLLGSIDTFKDYLGQAVKMGILHKAGKGWYSRLDEAPSIDPGSVTELIRSVEDAFPLLDFSTWSTTQLNPWMHHLLAQPVLFLNAPADTLDTVGDNLRGEGWDVAVNPPPSAASKAIRPGEKMVVLRPTLSRQPTPDNRQASLEQMLVDLLVENSHCRLMDDSEAKDVASKTIHSCLLKVAGMQRYAESRKLYWIESIFNPLPSLDEKK